MKQYQLAQIEPIDDEYKVFYFYLNPSTHNYERFEIKPRKKRRNTKEWSEELCISTNKALKRYYNPFENDDELEHQTQEESVVGLAQLSTSTLFLLAARRWKTNDRPFRFRNSWVINLVFLALFIGTVANNLFILVRGKYYEIPSVPLKIIFISLVLVGVFFEVLVAQPKYDNLWTQQNELLPKKHKMVWSWVLISIYVIALSLAIITGIFSCHFHA